MTLYALQWVVGGPWQPTSGKLRLPSAGVRMRLTLTLWWCSPRVSWELDNNSHIAAISVLLTLPREVMETCHDGPSFAAKADLGILNGWGEGHGVVSVVAIADPLVLLRYPRGEDSVPPTQWEEAPLPLQSAAVVLTIAPQPIELLPTFTKVGTFPGLRAMRAQDRQGVVRVVEIDLLQRPRPRQREAQWFGRRALADLIKATAAAPGGFPSLPLQGLVQIGDMLRGNVDLPASLAATVVQASGLVRGVFVRPWVAAGPEFPLPPGFTPTSHKVVWLKVARYSDLLVAALRAGGVQFDGGQSRCPYVC